MFSNIQTRFFSVSRVVYNTVEKSALLALRKKTGYSFIHIKKALLLHEQDLAKAETWLRKQAQIEGWAKVTALKGRSTANGVVGVHHEGTSASIVEIMCETDFVARTLEFKKLVSQIAKVCSSHASEQSLTSPLSKWKLSSEELNKISVSDSQKVEDLVALSVGELKENITLNRAVCLKVDDQFKLSGYSHPSQKVDENQPNNFVGQYGTLLVYKTGESSTSSPKRQADLAQQICQHVVGLNPSNIGSIEEWKKAHELKQQKEAEKENKEKEEASKELTEPETYINEEGDLVEAIEQVQTFDENEERLLHQEFLLNPDITVGEVVTNHQLEVVEFVRFQCGEKVEPTLDNISRLE